MHDQCELADPAQGQTTDRCRHIWVAYLDYISPTVELHDGDLIRSAKIKENEPIVNELEYFIRTVTDRRSHIFEDAGGSYVLKTTLAAVRSYREGRLVGVGG